MRKFIAGALPLVFVLGCASTPPGQEPADRNNRAIGSAVGAVTGALIGVAAGDGKGALIGAAVGGATGYGVGHVMDKQEEEFRSALRAEREQHAIEIQRLKEDTIKLTLNEGVSFDVNSAQIKPSFYTSLDKLADILQENDTTNVTVVGHTDSTGSDSYNQSLSERRAQAVSNYLSKQGVNYARLTNIGAGEAQPRATNATADGRSANRRVELIVQQPKSTLPENPNS